MSSATAAAAASAAHRASGPRRPSARPARGTTSPVWALTRSTLRELVFSQVLGQFVALAVMTSLVVLIGFGLLNVENTEGHIVGGYAATSLMVGGVMTFIHGIVMASRTPALLCSGATRVTVGQVHALTGLMLGLWLTALTGILIIPDLILSGRADALEVTVAPYLTPAATVCGFLLYLLGGSVALTFLRRPWWVGLPELLAAFNLGSLCVAATVDQWGSAAGGLWLAVVVALVLAAGPLAYWLQLHHFQPRR